MLRKNAVGVSVCCQISSQNIFIFEESYEYFSLEFSYFEDQNTEEILLDTAREIFIKFPEISRFVKGNLATPGGFYGVLPLNGSMAL